MDANAPRRGRRTRPRLGAPALACGVVALVAVVAVASSGSAPDGGIAERRPSEGLMDTFISLVLVVMVVSTIVTGILLSFFGRHASDMRVRMRSSPKQRAVTVLVVALSLALLTAAFARRGDGLGIFGQGPPPAASDGDPTRGDPYDPEFAVWPVVAVVALTAIAILAWWLAARGRRSANVEPRTTPAEALADVLAATLDDLRSERDPRRAVIRAYARMERSLAAAGLPRDPSEAPEEYLQRVLAAAAVSDRAAVRLTTLFEHARFSTHEIAATAKDEAISALEEIQDELAAAELEREARLTGALM